MNPSSKRQTQRLWSAIQASRDSLRDFREKRIEYLKEYVGFHYGVERAVDRTPVNYLQMATSLYLRQLASRAPRVTVTTPYTSLRPIAENLRIVTQRAIEHMRLEQTIRELIAEAMFGLGIVKVGLARQDPAPLADVGRPYARVVQFEDWVHDTSAKSWDDVRFEGNRYQVTRTELLNDPTLIDRDAVMKLPTLDRFTNDTDGETRAIALSRQASARGEEGLDEKIELYDIYLRDQRLLVTFEATSGEIVKIVENDDWDYGPYEKLFFDSVPGNLMPIPPAALIMDLHVLSNTLFVKAMRQAANYKKIVIVPPEAVQKDGNIYRRCEDGEYVVASNPEKVIERAFHGADPALLAMYMESRMEFNRLAGNVDALAGLGASAGTLGQDQMITGAASERIAAMEERKNEVVNRVVRHIAWLLYTDPLTTYRIPKRIPVLNHNIAVSFTPEQRSADFLLFNFDIQANSMGQFGPQQKLAALDRIVERAAPLAPFLQAEGAALNASGIIRTAVNLENMDELLPEIITFPTQSPLPGPDAVESAGKPPVTERHYVRHNRGSTTPNGRDRAMSSALLGINQNGNVRQKAAQ